MRPPPRQASADTAGGAGGPLDLIHRNKVPNPASMRVPGRLSLCDLEPSAINSWLDFMAGPVGRLILERRAAYAAKSAR